MKRTRFLPVFAALLLGVAAQADDEVAATAASAVPAEESDSIAAFASATPISTETLGEMNGKAQIQVDKIQINDQDVTGVVNDNVAIDNETGHNTIADGAYTDSAGFMTTIQNTGNNVLIQNATIINVTVEP
jgi:hypothetical protein